MTAALEASTGRLAEARRSGNADDIAEALAVHANDLLQHGRTHEARVELDEAAAIHRSRGRAYDEARCTHFAATLCRFEGRYDDAIERARRALSLIEFKGPIAVAAHAELGETALAQRRYADAADEYHAALQAGNATGLVESGRAALHRQRAVALIAAARFDEALSELRTAHDLLAASGDAAGARRMLIEQATALRHAGRPDEAARLVGTTLDAAAAAGDRAAQADLQLLVAAAALDRRDAAAAMTAAEAARSHALAATAPTSYIAAAITIGELAEKAGDRAAAYEALAVGWATLSDLLGPAAARLAFEPKLTQLRERWGAEAFDAVKSRYESHRRQSRAQ
jgi:tetratricopeptide (TPR) repeat protein